MNEMLLSITGLILTGILVVWASAAAFAIRSLALDPPPQDHVRKTRSPADVVRLVLLVFIPMGAMLLATAAGVASLLAPLLIRLGLTNPDNTAHDRAFVIGAVVAGLTLLLLAEIRYQISSKLGRLDTLERQNRESQRESHDSLNQTEREDTP